MFPPKLNPSPTHIIIYEQKLINSDIPLLSIISTFTHSLPIQSHISLRVPNPSIYISNTLNLTSINNNHIHSHLHNCYPCSIMSITGGFPTHGMDRFHRKSTHRRNGSDELDVFEARRYFDGGHEGAIYSQKISMMREIERPSWGGRRVSLDVPDSFSSQSHRVVADKQAIKEKKYKQPRSPGGRLASFLNSLFHQAASKKKKSKSNTSQSLKDDDESPGGRRRRRSSISHFQSSSSSEMKSLYSSSSNSGFRTPPPYHVNTPTKCYKDIASTNYSDKRINIVPSSRCTHQVDGLLNEKRKTDLARLDDKLKFIDVVSEKGSTNKVSSESNGTMFSDFKEMDEGADSDSSSDLFELQNYDLGVYSSGLPVYETTRIESIKRS